MNVAMTSMEMMLGHLYIYRVARGCLSSWTVAEAPMLLSAEKALFMSWKSCPTLSS